MADPSFDDAIAILGGTGEQGLGLALRFAKAGRPVLIGSRNAERANAAAERVRAAIAAHPFATEVEGETAALTASIGVASVTGAQDHPKHLIRRADEALYRAKEGGRNKVELDEEPEEG